MLLFSREKESRQYGRTTLMLNAAYNDALNEDKKILVVMHSEKMCGKANRKYNHPFLHFMTMEKYFSCFSYGTSFDKVYFDHLTLEVLSCNLSRDLNKANDTIAKLRRELDNKNHPDVFVEDSQKVFGDFTRYTRNYQRRKRTRTRYGIKG